MLVRPAATSCSSLFSWAHRAFLGKAPHFLYTWGGLFLAVCFSEGAEAVEEVVQGLAHGVPCEEHPQERLPLPPARVPCLAGLPPVQGPLRDAQGGGDLGVGEGPWNLL
jgi:hypothetical protein